jgi:hypothetical protein
VTVAAPRHRLNTAMAGLLAAGKSLPPAICALVKSRFAGIRAVPSLDRASYPHRASALLASGFPQKEPVGYFLR